MSSGSRLMSSLLPLLLSVSRAAPPPVSGSDPAPASRQISGWQSSNHRQLLQNIGNLQRPARSAPSRQPFSRQHLETVFQPAFAIHHSRQKRSADEGAAEESSAARQEKALQYLQYDFPGGYIAVSADDPAAIAAAAAGNLVALDMGDLTTDANGNELVSRSNSPFRKHSGNSPIYYIRLPPAPYVFVPGLGYVSQPNANSQSVAPQPPPSTPFVNLPLTFLSNGKPTGIYQPDWAPQRPVRLPIPTSPVFNLDKGPYIFNGRPTDLFVLRDTYDALYADALQNFYP